MDNLEKSGFSDHGDHPIVHTDPASRPLATAKMRSRGINSIKLKNFRDLAT
jgi:hypothetical protein